jgi:hypothetical protein
VEGATSERLSSLPTCALSSWDEFVHPDEHAAVEEARQKRALRVRAEYLIEMREKAGLTQVEVAEATGFPATCL